MTGGVPIPKNLQYGRSTVTNLYLMKAPSASPLLKCHAHSCPNKYVCVYQKLFRSCGGICCGLKINLMYVLAKSGRQEVCSPTNNVYIFSGLGTGVSHVSHMHVHVHTCTGTWTHTTSKASDLTRWWITYACTLWLRLVSSPSPFLIFHCFSFSVQCITLKS